MDVWGSARDNENQHGGYGFGAKNVDEERIIKFCVWQLESIFSEKRESNIVTYESGTANILVVCLAGGDTWKFLWKTWKS